MEEIIMENDFQSLLLSEIELHTQKNSDKITPKNLETLVERVNEDMRRKEILSKHTPAIKQLPNGRWYTRLNGRKIEKTNLKDLEDIIVTAYKGQATTLESVFDKYLERRKVNVADTTWQKDIRYFNTYVTGSVLGSKPIASINLDDGYAFLNHCLTIKPNMKKKYWNNLYGFLSQMFQYAIDQRIIEKNPICNMKPKKDLFSPPTITRDADTVFTKTEQSKVVTLAEEDAKKTGKSEPLGIVLLFNLGLRDGELCALKWGDIEQGKRGPYIHIQREMVVNVNELGKANGFKVLPHCKTPAGDRRLQLNLKAIQTLRQIKEINLKRNIPVGLNDYIFLRKEKDNLLNATPRSFDPRLRRYCREAGMEVIKSPHDIRRTVLTNLYEAHMPLKKIQEFAGHSSLKQTMDYIRITDDDLDMMQYLNQLSAEQPDTIISFHEYSRDYLELNTVEQI